VFFFFFLENTDYEFIDPVPKEKYYQDDSRT